MCVRMCYSQRMVEADDDVVSVRRFRAGLADFLRRAHEGEVITITRCGRVDAQLGPVEERSVTAEVEDR
jgi:prevent-host-death family protein